MISMQDIRAHVNDRLPEPGLKHVYEILDGEVCGAVDRKEMETCTNVCDALEKWLCSKHTIV
jgi:hypothetical protein